MYIQPTIWRWSFDGASQLLFCDTQLWRNPWKYYLFYNTHAEMLYPSNHSKLTNKKWIKRVNFLSPHDVNMLSRPNDLAATLNMWLCVAHHTTSKSSTHTNCLAITRWHPERCHMTLGTTWQVSNTTLINPQGTPIAVMPTLKSDDI